VELTQFGNLQIFVKNLTEAVMDHVDQRCCPLPIGRLLAGITAGIERADHRSHHSRHDGGIVS
jgi:hypothetical protein